MAPLSIALATELALVAFLATGQPAASMLIGTAVGFDAHMVTSVDFDVLHRAAMHAGKRAEPETSRLRHA